MNDLAAEFESVVKDYPGGWFGQPPIQAVRGVSLAIGKGEVFGLLGPNRAGKTTLIKLLLSLCRPSGGQLRRLGQPIAERHTLARVGYMHENHAFPRYLTAAELLRFYGGITLVPEAQLHERVPALLERVGLADRSREPIERFSKGMTQRLGLAQALINQPDLLVLDEPTEGLDLEGRRLLREVVRELRGAGKTVLLVSHVLTEVEQLCDRVAVIVAGRLVHLGPLAALTASGRPLEDVMRELYGSGGNHENNDKPRTENRE